MTEEEFAARKVELVSTYRKAKLLLDKEYAYANSPVKLGIS